MQRPGINPILGEKFQRAVDWLRGASQRSGVEQFELGLTFYELVAGFRPPLRGPIPALPHPGLDQIAQRLLARNPDDRYPGLESLGWDLDRKRWDEPGFVAGVGLPRERPAQPALIGRRQQLEQLLDFAPGLTVVLGPPGMGKTRLLEEAVRQALARGWAVWRAECLPSSHLSLQPFQDLAAELVRQPERWPAVEAQLGDWLSAVLRLFPLLRPLSQAPWEEFSGEFLDERNRQAGLRLLRALQPAVLVVDDVHWADPDVLWCLEQLDGPVWTGSRQPIQQSRREVVLQPLELGEVERLARSMCGPVECRELHTWSQGHPLLAAALLRNLCETGALQVGEAGWSRGLREPSWGELSPNLEDLLRQRSQCLSLPTQEVLRQAALLGRRFDHRLLDECEISACLYEGELGGLIYQVEPECWDFTHDLIWQELRRASGPSEKLAFHARVVERLLAMPEPPVEALAEHLWQSNQLEACLSWTLRAARQNQAVGQLEAAAHFWERAIHLQPDQRESWFAWGCCLRNLGRYEQAREPLQRALEMSADSWQRASCRARQGENEWKGGNLPQAAEHFRRGLAELGIRVPSGPLRWLAIARELTGLAGGPRVLSESQRLAARMLDHLAYTVVYSDGIGLVWANLRGLRLTARASGLERGILLASHAVLVVYVPILRWRARRCIREAMNLVQNHPQHLAQTRARYGSILMFTGEPEQAVPVLRQALNWLMRSGDRWEMQMTRYNLAYGLYWLGQLEESRQLAWEGWREARQARDWFAAACSARVLAALGTVPEDFYHHFSEAQPQPLVESLRQEVLGVLELVRGRAGGAVEFLKRACALSKDLGMSLDQAWQSSWLATAYRSQAELAPLAERPDLYRQGLVAAEVACRLGFAGYQQYLPHALRERGWCRLGLGGTTRCFEQSLEWARRLKMETQIRLTAADMSRAGLSGPEGSNDAFWQFRPPAASAARLAARFEEAVLQARRILQAPTRPEVLARAEKAAESLLGSTSCRAIPGQELPIRSDVLSSLSIPLGSHGILACYHHDLSDRFGEEEVRLGGFLGAVVGAALDSVGMLEALRSRELWLARLFEAVPVGVASLDERGTILQANTALREMLGADLEGRLLSEFEYRGPGADGTVYSGCDGNLIWADQRVTRLGPDRSVVSLSDISWRRIHQVAAFQEQERRLLGIDVHDVSQPLIGLCYQLTALGQQQSAEVARGVLSDLRSLMFDLRTPQLEDFDLAQSVKDLVYEVCSLGALQCQVEIAPEVSEASGLAALFAYRITLEGMSNVRRHSAAQRVLLRLRVVGSQLWASLCDDGP
ncbi:AAA family ATPase, partial [bacterium]|nr:AAA family ATPase [bacterium]